MINLVRTDSAQKDFVSLIRLLDAELGEIDGAEHSFYAQFNKIDVIRHTVVVYENGEPVACGAIKQFDAASVEVKRMYTLPQSRGKGIGGRVLSELEKWAAELNYTRCVLETGKRQPDAIALYKRQGYKQMPNYGQYAGIENSVCFEKMLLP